MPIKAVSFDIDGTLYPASAIFLRLFMQGLPKIKLLAAFSKVRQELRTLLTKPEFLSRNIDSMEALHRFQANLTASLLKRDPQQVYEDIETFFYSTSTEAFTAIKPFPAVAPVLDNLREKGFPLGALSDFPGDRKLRLLGLAEKFNVSMTSEETGRVKPDRASFDLLARRLGVPNQELLYVGTSEAYDVQGAKSAGMQTALISWNLRVKTEADFVFFDWKSLEHHILSNS
jgi:putative hydrolase of the HAD superfamily